jgi:hypothetical protein
MKQHGNKKDRKQGRTLQRREELTNEEKRNKKKQRKFS